MEKLRTPECQGYLTEALAHPCFSVILFASLQLCLAVLSQLAAMRSIRCLYCSNFLLFDLAHI
jgi:hypothetical protein